MNSKIIQGPRERILAKGIKMSSDTRTTGLNNNDLIVGPSGAGKTRGYVIPNILQANENLIVADTKGNLCRLYGAYLESKGYRVMKLDFTAPANSPYGYNPLSFIRKNKNKDMLGKLNIYKELDIRRTASAICPIEDFSDPFWDNAARMYLECLIDYVLNYLPAKEALLSTVYELLSFMGSVEFEVVIKETCDLYPESSFARRYRMIKQNRNAEKMDASIRGILAHHLDEICYPDTEVMFKNKNQITLKEFYTGKTALFLSVSDSDRCNDVLVNLFYTQALQFLMRHADNQPDSRLEIPVRFIFDDFSTNTVIQNFDGIISVIRSRDISVSLIIQSISQLEGLYGTAAAQTIINNCDNCLYLGGQDVQTAEYFAKKLNKTVSTVINLPLDSAFLFTRGREPRRVEKYDLSENEDYRMIIQKKSGKECFHEKEQKNSLEETYANG